MTGKPDPAEPNAIRAAQAVGQSIWLDFISRNVLRSGELARLVEMGVTGVTSNPTIFAGAISEGTDYDESLLALAREGRDDTGIYEGLAFRDIADAAGVLRPVYDATGGRDGFVSIEVDPRLARDADGTIAEARRIHRTLGQPNVMIKVPATDEGMPAIRQLISEGINVNATLIFSRDMYRKAAEAYLAGLAARLAAGERDLSTVASVASFFVSRVDTAVDNLLGEGSALRGKTGIANAKLAYSDFQKLFGSERFARLADAGATPQRTLWASTSVKNPAYRDVMYLEGLLGPNTVNTAPPATLDAFLDHGAVAETITVDVEAASSHFEQLKAAGVDMDAVTDGLLEAGVQAFTDSFESLLGSVAAKRRKLMAA